MKYTINVREGREGEEGEGRKERERSKETELGGQRVEVREDV